MGTHTRTHVHTVFACPYLQCRECRAWVDSWHDQQRCGCGEIGIGENHPCGHRAGVECVCPSWGPVDGCTCPPGSHQRR